MAHLDKNTGQIVGSVHVEEQFPITGIVKEWCEELEDKVPLDPQEKELNTSYSF